MPPSIDELISRVAALPAPPVAFEALWDDDPNDWWLGLSAVVPQADGYAAIPLCGLQGSDITSLSAQAQGLGSALAAHFGLPFYFPSPDRPEDGCPHWWEQDRGTPCRRCGIPLLQRPDARWPGICYFCHLDEERERRAALTPEERAGPRCQICGGPAPGESDADRRCPRCRERYRHFQCRACGSPVLVAVDYYPDMVDDLCLRCAAQERLAQLPRETLAALRLARAAGGERAARNVLEDLPGWSFEVAYIAVRLLENLSEPAPGEEER